MTRYEYDRLKRVRRVMVGLPSTFSLALNLFDKVLGEAEKAFHIEDVHHTSEEKAK